MNPGSVMRSVLIVALIAASVSSCSLNPNVRKQNDFANGKSYLEKGDYRAAVIDFTNAIRIDPHFTDAHRQLANTYLKLHQTDLALQQFAEVLELQPDDGLARIAMTTLLISTRRFSQAKEETALLLRQRPQDPAVHALIASLLEEEGNFQSAIAEMQKAIALSPGRWPPYLSLALLEWKANQPLAAEATLKEVIALNPRAVQPRVLLGTFYESQGRLDDAGHQFHDAMALDASSMDAREALAKLYLAQGKQGDAEAILVQANRDLPRIPESYLALSNYYYVTGNLDKAVAVYQALYQFKSTDLQVKKKYIELLVQTRRFSQAGQLANEILKETPGDPDALLFQSEMQVSDGELAQAVPTLQMLIKNAPQNSEAHYALGVAFKKQGNLAGAEAEWREALRLNPNSLSAERAVADSAMERGDMRGLQVAATQLIRMQPASPQGYALRALSNINMKQYELAELDIQKATGIAPQSAYGFVQLGNLRLAQGRYKDAVQAFQDALNRNMDSVDAVRGLASAYLAGKDADKAANVMRSAIARSPSNSTFYDQLGEILFRGKNDMSGADAVLKKATALNQHDSTAWIELCEVEAAQGKTDKAIQVDEQGLNANPTQIGLYLVLGNLYESKSDWNSAESAYRNAQTIDPRNPIASVYLARAMLHTGGNLEAALSLAQSARRAMPESPLVADTVGWIYYQQGLYSLAVSSLQDALRFQQSQGIPDYADLHYHLGMTYTRLKQNALARQQFRQVLKLNPSDQNAAQARRELSGL